MTEDELEELAKLQREWSLCSMGDRPPSMAMAKLRRLIALEAKMLARTRAADLHERTLAESHEPY